MKGILNNFFIFMFVVSVVVIIFMVIVASIIGEGWKQGELSWWMYLLMLSVLAFVVAPCYLIAKECLKKWHSGSDLDLKIKEATLAKIEKEIEILNRKLKK